MNRRIFGLCIILLFSMPLVAQDHLNKAELTAYFQQQLQTVNGFWKQNNIAAAVAVLEQLNAHPQIHDLEEYRSGSLCNLACEHSLIKRKEKALATLDEAITYKISSRNK